jgi:hypothetical protein
MAFDQKAFEEAVYSRSAPLWKYRGIEGCFETFGDALASFRPFVDYVVRETVVDLLRNFPKLEQAWRTFVHRRGVDITQQYLRATGDYQDEEAWNDMHETEETLLNDHRARARWVTRQVNERLFEIRAEIKVKSNMPGGEYYDQRDTYPLEGCFSRSGKYVLPMNHIAGFCPKCIEPLQRDVLVEYAPGEFSLRCPACRIDGQLSQLEYEFGRWFGCLPFTDVPISDVVPAA